MANLKHIAATLAVLGTGTLALSGCNKDDATTTPDAAAAAGDAADGAADDAAGAADDAAADAGEGGCEGDMAEEAPAEEAAAEGEEAPAEEAAAE
jgi:hypothetical protein